MILLIKYYLANLQILFAKNFSCVCYPSLKPYTQHKFLPRSTLCVYLWVYIVHHTHLYFYAVHSKIFVSREVQFCKDTFPFTQMFSHLKNKYFTLKWEIIELKVRKDRHPEVQYNLDAVLVPTLSPLIHTPSPQKKQKFPLI